MDKANYPGHIQVCRITSTTIPGPTASGSVGSSTTRNYLHVAFVEQLDPATQLMKDRESCLVLDVNQVVLSAGYYGCRLAGSYLGLPLYIPCGIIAASGGSADVADGTYTPIESDLVNLTGATSLHGQWLRVGSTVTVSGELLCLEDVGGIGTSLLITLPVASNFTSQRDAAGWVGDNLSYGQIRASSSADKASLEWVSHNPAASPIMRFHFTYRVK